MAEKKVNCFTKHFKYNNIYMGLFQSHVIVFTEGFRENMKEGRNERILGGN